MRTNLIKYEIRNTLGNFIGLFFGFIFPPLFGILLNYTLVRSLPNEAQQSAAIQIFLSNALIVPLALLLVGFPALYAQELEKNITRRINLFGYSNIDILIAKAVANGLIVLLALASYIAIMFSITSITVPDIKTTFVFFILFTIISILLFTFAYAVSLITKKFGKTYFITMTLYFVMMFLSGMMGLQISDFPQSLNYISSVFPLRYIIEFTLNLWVGNELILMGQLVQSLIIFGSIVGILLWYAISKNRLNINK